jgi:alanine dehydrogenase
VVETGAGLGVNATDTEYREAGALIASQEEVWNTAGLLLKYKAPLEEEWPLFRKGLSVASFMHAEGNPPLVEAMRRSTLTAYAFEFFRTSDGEYPVPVSDNEIAGKLAVMIAAYHLQCSKGGRGVLLSDVPNAPLAKVVVIGYGHAGGAAARLAASMGAEVTVFGTRPHGLRRAQAFMPANVRVQLCHRDTLERAVLEADVVIGAILVSTFDTPAMLDEGLVRRMKQGAVIVDVTCGYGAGYMPTFDRLTCSSDPVYERFGVLHCKIDAMPASVPVSAAPATSRNIVNYLLPLAADVLGSVSDPVSRAGLIVEAGHVVHPELVRHVAMRKSQAAGAEHGS